MDFICVDDIVEFLCKKPAFARSVMEKLTLRFSEQVQQKEESEVVKTKANVKTKAKPEAKTDAKPKTNATETKVPGANIAPVDYNLNLCLAKVKSGCQCSRKPKGGSMFCGLHKTQKYGCVVSPTQLSKANAPQVEPTEENAPQVEATEDNAPVNAPEPQVEPNDLNCKDAKEILLDVMLAEGIMHNVHNKLKPSFKNSVYDNLNESDNEEDEEDEYEDVEI